MSEQDVQKLTCASVAHGGCPLGSSRSPGHGWTKALIFDQQDLDVLWLALQFRPSEHRSLICLRRTGKSNMKNLLFSNRQTDRSACQRFGIAAVRPLSFALGH